MSLKTFHIAFITLSIILAFGFALWVLLTESARQDGVLYTLGAVSFVAGGGLIVYARQFLRKLKGVSYL